VPLIFSKSLIFSLAESKLAEPWTKSRDGFEDSMYKAKAKATGLRGQGGQGQWFSRPRPRPRPVTVKYKVEAKIVLHRRPLILVQELMR